jgi:hypothetical protein
MGGARYSDVDWTKHSTRSYAGKSTASIFTEDRMDPSLDPAKVGPRECRDSEANPAALPIILASDVTGSMGYLSGEIIKKHLGGIFRMLYNRKPVADPQILCAAVGDAECDTAPLQVTQFEADGVALSKQLEKVYLEGGGGGNGGEGYTLVWAWAAYRTKVDAFKKRGKKGYIFTIGDECPLPTIKKSHLEMLGFKDPQGDMDSRVLLEHARNDWHIFHLIVKPVPHQRVVATWEEYLGPNAIVVQSVDDLAIGITAVIETVEGLNAKAGRTSTELAVVNNIVDAVVVR